MEAVKQCQEHMVANGQIDRSVKEAGDVMRKRRCSKCHFLIITTEKTEDKIAHERAEVQNRDRELRVELSLYKRAYENTRRVFNALEMVKEDIEEDWEMGNEKRD